MSEYVLGPADPRPPKPYMSGEGYVYYQVQVDGETHTVQEHQLVMLAEGADPEKLFSGGEWHVHHENNLSWDNRPENLSLEHSEDHAKMTNTGRTPMRRKPPEEATTEQPTEEAPGHARRY